MVTSLKGYSKLKGFATHDVIFEHIGDKEAVGTCPFCGKRKKLYVNHKSAAWDCKRCGRQGGFLKFLEYSMERYQKLMTKSAARRLSKDRGLKRSTLRAFGFGFNGVDTYMLPIIVDGKTIDIRRYKVGGKFYSTPGVKGPMLIKITRSKRVWVCEGEWDCMAVWEAIKQNTAEGSIPEGLIGLAGASSFPSKYAPMLHDKDVAIAMDYDDAGDRGDAKTRGALDGFAKSIMSVHWEKGTEVGYDCRKYYIDLGCNGVKLMTKLKKSLRLEPRFIEQPQGKDGQSASSENEDLDGNGLARNTIVRRYRKHLHLPNPEPLDVIYGTLYANRIEGEPVWLFLVSPPGGGKTALLMSLHEAPLIMTTTTLTPQALVSGASFPQGGDPSMIPRLDGKVLVVKDFTTILSMHHKDRDLIFGILRDAFDGQFEKFFGTGVHRVYESTFGIIAGVTPAIERFSAENSVVGERFIKYRLRQKGGVKAGIELIRRAVKNISKENRIRAKLMDIAQEALNRPITRGDIPKLSEPMIDRFIGLAQWVAVLRGTVGRQQYTGEVLFKPVSEIGSRLAQQLTKLAMGIAMLHRRKRVTEYEYRVAVQVARDTAPDRVEEVVHQIYVRRRDDYATTTEIAAWTRFPRATILKVLQDMNLLRIVRMKRGGRGLGLWRLSPNVVNLMRPLYIYSDKQQDTGNRKLIIGSKRVIRRSTSKIIRVRR